ncbi:DUF6338 family protein [Amycolatopsis sp. NPDC088138]|uniref:DUF6338 family protein n=1 Tax=Amycolatopsis sp. NPDC088138 TaxID=3363938 RepID=UPI0038010DC9
MDAKTWQQLIVIIGAVLPGFVFQVVSGWLRGTADSDRPVSSRLFALISLTAIFDVFYVWAFGGPIRYVLAQLGDPLRFARLAGLAVLLLVFIVPSSSALVWHWWRVSLRVGSFKFPSRELLRGSRYQTSWDYAAEHAFAANWVRIRYKDGTQLGGFVEKDFGHMSQSPGRRDLYVANLWALDDSGNFASKEESERNYPHDGFGVWVNCEDAISVEFIQTPPGTADDPEEEVGRWLNISTPLAWLRRRPRWMLRVPKRKVRSPR